MMFGRRGGTWGETIFPKGEAFHYWIPTHQTPRHRRGKEGGGFPCHNTPTAGGEGGRGVSTHQTPYHKKRGASQTIWAGGGGGGRGARDHICICVHTWYAPSYHQNFKTVRHIGSSVPKFLDETYPHNFGTTTNRCTVPKCCVPNHRKTLGQCSISARELAQVLYCPPKAKSAFLSENKSERKNLLEAVRHPGDQTPSAFLLVSAEKLGHYSTLVGSFAEMLYCPKVFGPPTTKILGQYSILARSQQKCCSQSFWQTTKNSGQYSISARELAKVLYCPQKTNPRQQRQI